MPPKWVAPQQAHKRSPRSFYKAMAVESLNGVVRAAGHKAASPSKKRGHRLLVKTKDRDDNAGHLEMGKVANELTRKDVCGLSDGAGSRRRGRRPWPSGRENRFSFCVGVYWVDRYVS